MANYKTHRADEVYIDEKSCRATGSIQWLLEKPHKEGTHPITANNLITFHICGEEGFGAIAADLKDARQSVDLVCWGFDPGMELARKGGEWKRGQTYGELLHDLATRKDNPVKVRLLIWYSYVGGLVQKHMPGYTDAIVYNSTSTEDQMRDAGGLGRLGAANRTPLVERADYCVMWWRWALDKKNAHLIEVRMRDGDKDANRRALKTDPYTRPSSSGVFPYVNEKALLEDSGTHHQKTVMIDYAYQDGAKAVGYVMGLNSLTDYWDSASHRFNDERREYDETGKSETFERLKKEDPRKATRVRRDPYRDYACRIEGGALQRVNDNFADGWLRAGGDASKLKPARLGAKNYFGQGSRVQIVRTQPTDQDQTIRDTYWQASSFARNYLYIENQYFQYEEWARWLKTCRQDFRQWFQNAGQPSDKPGILHAFIVIPKPEKAQMQPRTFDTVKSLGRSDQMHDIDDDGQDRGQYVEMKKEDEYIEGWKKSKLAQVMTPEPQHSEVGASAAAIQEPSASDLESMGLKVLIAMLVSYDDGASGLRPKDIKARYRQVYIHSKLMVIDDAFVTLGSANINQRSMLTDSEINMATDDHGKAKDLRQRVWGQIAGGALNGADGSSRLIARAFEDWQQLMQRNDGRKKQGQPLEGFLCTFRDSKFSYERWA
ncbi:phosphatidylserine/phosphatidylglycerophosphate/cardiolipin synthase family protein [Variovorax sp. OV329]|uniref:phospholipase D-like domain-containing protein n=1 Tax=Variovorax sp. OV329 TaxID=1882825 RepID=UPI0008E527E1|nr:phospholipase D-like domain-containing protein [Variovorax sp. OV329]SFM09898.1 PLD-like domain-containing protein [Variovorax sp. OV329]